MKARVDSFKDEFESTGPPRPQLRRVLRRYGPNGDAVDELIGRLGAPGVPWFFNLGRRYSVDLDVVYLNSWAEAWATVAADRGWLPHLKMLRSLLNSVTAGDPRHSLALAWDNAHRDAHDITRRSIEATDTQAEDDSIGKTAAFAGRAALELVLGHLPGVPCRAMPTIPWLLAGHFVCGYQPDGRLVVF